MADDRELAGRLMMWAEALIDELKYLHDQQKRDGPIFTRALVLRMKMRNVRDGFFELGTLTDMAAELWRMTLQYNALLLDPAVADTRRFEDLQRCGRSGLRAFFDRREPVCLPRGT